MTNTCERSTVQVLLDIFNRHGFTEIIVSNNGQKFLLAVFQQFCFSNGILHLMQSFYCYCLQQTVLALAA